MLYGRTHSARVHIFGDTPCYASWYRELEVLAYNNGHMMVVPYAHVDSIAQLDEDTLAEMMVLVQRAQAVVEEGMGAVLGRAGT